MAKTSTDTYRERKELGVCVRCGDELDRKGVYCNNCCQKRRTAHQEDKIFYRQIGICPICKKNKLFENEKHCPECKAKSAKYAQHQRDKNRYGYNLNASNCHKKIYHDRVDNSLCYRCGKPLTDSRYKACEQCREKFRNSRPHMDYRKERISQGLCVWCNNPQKPGYKLCEEHYKLNIEVHKKEVVDAEGNQI